MALRMADRPSNSRPFVSPSELSLVYSIRMRWHFHNSELLYHYQVIATTGWIWMALCGVRIVAEQNYHHRPPSTVADFINAMMDGLKRTLLHFSMVTTWHARFFTHVYWSAYLVALCGTLALLLCWIRGTGSKIIKLFSHSTGLKCNKKARRSLFIKPVKKVNSIHTLYIHSSWQGLLR